MINSQKINEIKKKLGTKNQNTWCPGCSNFMILEAVKNAVAELIFSRDKKQEDFAIVTGVGRKEKIFDYINLSGVYSLHGRVVPTAIGMKLGNPNLTVLGFEGDGDCYSEGIAHFIHACRFNPNMTLIVHNNQAFSLTTGQATPVSQKGYKTKAQPLGEFSEPLNPMKIALSSGASFVARCSAMDLKHTSQILVEAIKHPGFSIVEIIQPCLQFNKEMNSITKLMYKINNNKNDMNKAMQIANEWNYNSALCKIPMGIFYQEKKQPLEDKWPQLSKLMKRGKGWN